MDGYLNMSKEIIFDIPKDGIHDDDTILIVGNLSSVCITGKDIPSLGRASVGNTMIKGNKIKSVSKV